MSSRRNGARGQRRPRRPRRRLGDAVFVLGGEGAAPNHRSPSRKRGKDRRENRRGSKKFSSSEEQHPEHTYKTEMCNNWIEYGSCRYNEKCRFAHGEDELRVARRIKSEKKWKSELCRNYHSGGTCLYGRRCHFIHEETPEELARMHATQKRVGGIKKMDTEKMPPELERRIAAEKRTTLSSPLELASQVTTLSLCPGVNPLSASSVPAAPIPISRKRSLQEFCERVGLPVEEINPNDAAEADWILEPSHQTISESTPFFMRPQATFGHMSGKTVYQPVSVGTPADFPRTTPKMDSDSPAMRRVRLPVFKRIASDTGVSIVHPQSPVTTCP